MLTHFIQIARVYLNRVRFLTQRLTGLEYIQYIVYICPSCYACNPTARARKYLSLVNLTCFWYARAVGMKGVNMQTHLFLTGKLIQHILKFRNFKTLAQDKTSHLYNFCSNSALPQISVHNHLLQT